ncbi:hypothetical protein B0I12_002523 [Microbacterium hydrothermale]|uniref:hypothetical protein n=1 Tax=Microbacterium hydrothermale TaxID=857427 RepID=UPI002227BBDA|nr:hypothetical protein [Microbacterium hydrothermale]MCW2165368.1 hypothetical protein [Microbacterium hydrothermale]
MSDNDFDYSLGVLDSVASEFARAARNLDPRRVYTGADIVSGLRALADLIETKPWIAAGVRIPSVPQHFTLGLAERRDVEALAVVFDGTVHEAEQDDVTYVSTEGRFDGLRVSAYTVIHHTRPLRRDPEATAELAERDA